MRLIHVAIGSLLLGAACSSTGSGSAATGGRGPQVGTGTGNGSGQTGSGGAGPGPGSGGSGVGVSSGGNTGNSSSGGSVGGPGGTIGGGTGGGALGGSGFINTGGAMGTGGAPPACLAPTRVTTGTAATVTVNAAATPIGRVSPDLLGVHTAVYDGLLTISLNTMAWLKAAGVTSLRYPGGSYADLYHWATNTGTATPAAGAGSNVIYVAETANFGRFASILPIVGANALITVNYGMDSLGTGPGQPQEAAAWVAYANALPTNTTVIGVDATGRNWMTAGYWASLRASAPLAVDDMLNFLRINHPAPFGIRYWEVGNELYGNGYYQGSDTFAGWEADFHAPYNGVNGAARRNNPALSPATYGMGVRAFSQAMKAVDPTVQIGGIVHWPYTEYADWNGAVLPQACASMDFAVNHWYAGGAALESLLTIAQLEIPAMFSALRVALLTASNNCGAKGATMPIAITEWGPNTFQPGIGAALAPAAPALPTRTQIGGVFAAESYANFMEQGALSVHWAQLHDRSYLFVDPAVLIGADASETGYGYHGAVMAHYLAGGGDLMLPKPAVSNAGALMTLLQTHASRHADGSVSVMLTNTSPTVAANVTVNVTGGTLACVGTVHTYAPAAGDLDGPVVNDYTFSSATGNSVAVAVPAFSVVVINFPPR